MKFYEKPQFEMTIIKNQDIISISGITGTQTIITPANAVDITGYNS